MRGKQSCSYFDSFLTRSEYYLALLNLDLQKLFQFDNNVQLKFFLFKEKNEWIRYYFIVHVKV